VINQGEFTYQTGVIAVSSAKEMVRGDNGNRDIQIPVPEAVRDCLGNKGVFCFGAKPKKTSSNKRPCLSMGFLPHSTLIEIIQAENEVQGIQERARLALIILAKRQKLLINKGGNLSVTRKLNRLQITEHDSRFFLWTLLYDGDEPIFAVAFPSGNADELEQHLDEGTHPLHNPFTIHIAQTLVAMRILAESDS